jgi:peptidylprolyl isomerase
MRRRLALATTAAMAITGLAACGSDDTTGSDGAESADTGSDSVSGLTVTGDFGKKPKVKVDGMDVDDVESTVVIEGEGDELTAEGAAMTRVYIAKGSDGSELASSFADEAPYKMVVSQQPEVIGEAVTGQSIGTRVALAMPASELYGEQGNTQLGLAADDDLVLVLDLLEAAEAPLTAPEGTEVDPPADAPKVVGEDGNVAGLDFSDAPAKAPKKLQVIPLVEGEGAEVKLDDPVTVDYYGAVWGSDAPFDESYSRQPAAFTLSKGALIDGWVEGLQGVTVGSRVMLVIPPSLGYGKEGSGEQIPGNSTLVFVVDVLGAGA